MSAATQPMAPGAGTPAPADGSERARGDLLAVLEPIWQAIVPVILAIVASGILLAVIGRNPFDFYDAILHNGLLTDFGVQQSVTRMATLLLIAGGLIVAFRANLWNLGGDGQWLLAAAFVAGLAPSVVASLGDGLGLAVMIVVGCVVGALWTVVPAFLKAEYGVNEIISTLMMNFIGIALANILVKGPFLTDRPGVPRTDILDLDDRLPLLGNTQIHIGIVLAVAVMLALHYTMTRTPLGLRLRVLGANPRAALHLGLRPKRLTYIAFGASGALIGMSGAVSMLGDWGSFRADFNPAYGFLMVPLVFLARLNALGTIAFVGLFSVIQIGGDTATRQADLPTDFILVLVGLLLFFMTITEYVRIRRAQRSAYVPRGLGAGVKTAVGSPAPGAGAAREGPA
ncbi:MAG TPA: ABC transporter permease [Conexibacter sp.]|jgi:simple sugar transport system permease protein